MLQNTLVIIIILAASIHVIWRWMPIKLKQIFANKLSRLASYLHLSRTAKWFSKKTNSPSCSGCSSCNSCTPTFENKESAKKEMKISLKSY